MPGIEAAEELFRLKKRDDYFTGLLIPDNSVIFADGKPALKVYGNTFYTDRGGPWFKATIASACYQEVRFQYEQLGKARALQDMQEFIEWIESLSFRCPSRDEIDIFCLEHHCRYEIIN